MNRFLYALSNPATLIDPDGHRTTDGGGGGGPIGGGIEPVGSGGSGGSAEPVGVSVPGAPKPNLVEPPIISNDVIDLPRGSTAAWKSLDPTNLYHSFPNIVENYAGFATKVGLPDGKIKYLLEGWLTKGEIGQREIVTGLFEWIVQGGWLSIAFSTQIDRGGRRMKLLSDLERADAPR